jgi:hypothetical protein
MGQSAGMREMGCAVMELWLMVLISYGFSFFGSDLGQQSPPENLFPPIPLATTL